VYPCDNIKWRANLKTKENKMAKIYNNAFGFRELKNLSIDNLENLAGLELGQAVNKAILNFERLEGNPKTFPIGQYLHQYMNSFKHVELNSKDISYSARVDMDLVKKCFNEIFKYSEIGMNQFLLNKLKEMKILSDIFYCTDTEKNKNDNVDFFPYTQLIIARIGNRDYTYFTFDY